MKKLMMMLGLSAFTTTGAFAAGYSGPGAQDPLTTVAAALQAKDDTQVVLEGRLTQKLEDERYVFQDATGSINVEIDDEDLPAGGISDQSRVRLTGEVDKDLTTLEIDVDRVEVLTR